MNKIIPAILEKEWDSIEKKLKLVKPFADTVHIDIIDGKFAPNTTFLDPSPFKGYSDDFLLELHMMVENPIDYLKPWSECGFKRFLGHIERMADQNEFIAQGQLLGEVGIALDGPTPIEDINVNIFDLDCILIFTADQVGFSKQQLIEDRLEKIVQIKKIREDLIVEADGGISDTTLNLAKEAGASRFCSAGFIFKDEKVEENFKKLSAL